MGQHNKKRGRAGAHGVLLLATVIVGVLGSGISLVAMGSSTGDTDCSRDGTLNVGADSAALDWVRDLAAAYSRARHKVDGRCVRVDVRVMDPQRATAALQSTPYPAAGQPPDVWIPHSSALLDLVRNRSANAAVLPERAPSVTSSPLVLAAPAEAVAALPAAKDPSALLVDLLRLGTDPSGWKAVGHPEWGPVRFSLVDPATSATATSAVMGLAGLAAKAAPEAVTPKTFTDTRVKADLLQFIRATAVRATSSDQLLERVRSSTRPGDVLKAVGLVLLSEQDVWRYNDASPSVPLRAIYPLGGALAEDFPYVVPNGQWMTGFARRAAADFRAFLVSPDVQSRLSSYGLRRFDGSAGRLVDGDHGVTGDQLAPTPARDARAAVAARASWQLLTQRVLTLAVMDVSGSMGQRVENTNSTKLDLAVHAARNALPFYSDEDYTGLWEFSTDLQGGADYRELVPVGPNRGQFNGQPRRVALDQAYRSLTPQHNTALYDTTLAAYDAVRAAYRPGFVNTVVILTDGENEDSDSISLDRLLSELDSRQDPDRPVHIITIGYGDKVNNAALSRIAQATGGLSFAAPDPRDIGQVFLTALTSLSR